MEWIRLGKDNGEDKEIEMLGGGGKNEKQELSG